MKYKIIPDDIVKNLIEFLDEIQFEAASGNKPDDLHRINFINWMISELMNGIDGFDMVEEDEDEEDSDVLDRDDIIDEYRKDLRKDFPNDMSEEDWKKLIKNFDAFVAGWDRSFKKSNYKDKGKKDTLKSFERELRSDFDLTPEEKFELYYSEYKNRKSNERETLSQILRRIGIKRPPKK